MKQSCGKNLRDDLSGKEIIPLIGVYDTFSATLAARHFKGIFISGFSFAASFYGLPDIGFIAWSDIVAFVQRVRTLLPEAHIVVDIDDGYADTEVACHVVSLLESIGASGVLLEDQQRPRRCGHFDGKQIMDLQPFLEKLKNVLATRKEMVVIARTDEGDPDEIIKRVKAFTEAGADGILVDAVRTYEMIERIKNSTNRPLLMNQISGGKTPNWTLQQLKQAGVQLVIYSTPCLFAAQFAVEETLLTLKKKDGLLPESPYEEGSLKHCDAILRQNLARRL